MGRLGRLVSQVAVLCFAAGAHAMPSDDEDDIDTYTEEPTAVLVGWDTTDYVLGTAVTVGTGFTGALAGGALGILTTDEKGVPVGVIIGFLAGYVGGTLVGPPSYSAMSGAPTGRTLSTLGGFGLGLLGVGVVGAIPVKGVQIAALLFPAGGAAIGYGMSSRHAPPLSVDWTPVPYASRDKAGDLFWGVNALSGTF